MQGLPRFVLFFFNFLNCLLNLSILTVLSKDRLVLFYHTVIFAPFSIKQHLQISSITLEINTEKITFTISSFSNQECLALMGALTINQLNLWVQLNTATYFHAACCRLSERPILGSELSHRLMGDPCLSAVAAHS